MPRFDRLDYVILYVGDLERSIRFYRDVIGLDLKFAENGYAEFATAHIKFALFERTRLPELLGEAREGSGTAGEVLFLVADVSAEAERLRGLGVTVLSGPVDRSWGHRTLHIADPDGFVIEFAQEIPRSEP